MDKINFIVKDNDKSDFSIEAKGCIKVYPPLSNIEITPNKELQTFKNTLEYGYDYVTVKPIPENYIDPNGSLTIKENGVKNVREYQNVVVDIPEKEIKLQDKEVTPTKEVQNIKANGDYVGLNKVTVKAIPDEYVIPEGTLPITKNTTYDVTNYARVTASVHPAPNLQDKSITITENGTQNITADSGYDGLGNVEVNIEVAGSGGDVVDGTLPIGDYVQSKITPYLQAVSETYPTVTDESVTLYTPNADFKNYMIRNRNGSYGIIWFPCSVLGSNSASILNTRKLNVYLETDGYNILNDGRMQIPTVFVNAYTANFNTFDECVAALQNPNTKYSSTNNDTWTCYYDNGYRVSATNMACYGTDSNHYIGVKENCRRISSNETIKVIGE